jgi:hypothetical protein
LLGQMERAASRGAKHIVINSTARISSHHRAVT